MSATAIKVIGIFACARVPQGIEHQMYNTQPAACAAVAIRTGFSVFIRTNRIIVAVSAIHSDIDAAQAINNRLEPGEIDPGVVMYIDTKVVKMV